MAYNFYYSTVQYNSPVCPAWTTYKSIEVILELRSSQYNEQSLLLFGIIIPCTKSSGFADWHRESEAGWRIDFVLRNDAIVDHQRPQI